MRRRATVKIITTTRSVKSPTEHDAVPGRQNRVVARPSDGGLRSVSNRIRAFPGPLRKHGERQTAGADDVNKNICVASTVVGASGENDSSPGSIGTHLRTRSRDDGTCGEPGWKTHTPVKKFSPCIHECFTSDDTRF